MSVITALTPQVKDKNRINVYIDGEFVCGLQLETAIKYKLKTGVSLTKERLSEIEFESEKIRALEKATSYISKSMKTEKQLKDYLSGKGYGEQVVGYAISKLAEYGYVDDFSYATAYIRTYGNKKGERLLRFELKTKGVSDEDISKAFAMANQNENAVFAVAEKYMARKEITKENLAKLYKHLIGKGFNYDEVSEAVNKYKGD